MIEYAVLRVIWWILMGVLLAGFAVMDGFDLGVAMLLPIVARQDLERRVLINTVGPVWEGNQVWFILGAGALFAAWPFLYAISFSSFYLIMLLVLLAFIMRPVGFKYRSKIIHAEWRSIWDWILCLSGVLASFMFGIFVGNTLQGIPFHFDSSLRSFYTGTIGGLFNPFALLCGLLSVFMIAMQGAYYLVVKTEDVILARAKRWSRITAFVVIVLFAIGGFWVMKGINGYILNEIAGFNLPSHPLNQNVTQQLGAWTKNFIAIPALLIVPGLGFLGALAAIALSNRGTGKFAFICSSISVFFIIVTVGVTMFPFILPSSTEPSSSLLVWSASSGQLALMIMLISVIIFLPIILLYTAWVYRVLRGRINFQFFDNNKDAY